jgi:5-formyltetrahydrofolate cyclo-ligase
VSFADEVDTHQFITWAFEHQKQVVVPKITNDRISIHKITSLSECIPTTRGILEPQNDVNKISPQDIDVYIVPGLAFDVEGYRLGYGKGYYDQLLSQTTAPTIGIAYTDQLTYKLPREPHDIPVSHIITNSMSIQCSHKGVT